MAEKDTNVGAGGAALAGNPSALNTYNANPSDIDSYNEALQNSVQALKDRYANPNWFNVAAGFAKPQLGGFTASMGSASQALGEWQEQQRAQQLPIAQMQQQLALNKITMGQNAKIASDEAARKTAGTPVTSGYLANAQATAPNSPVTAAIGNAYTSQQKERELSHSELADAQTRVNYANATGASPDPKDMAILQGGSPTQKNPIVNPAIPGAGGAPVGGVPSDQMPTDSHGFPVIAPAQQAGQDSERLRILQEELKTETNPDTKAALQREIASTQAGLQQAPGAASQNAAQVPANQQGYAGLTAPQATMQTAENTKNTEAAYQPQINQIVSEGDPVKVKDTLHITSALSNLLSDPKVAAGVGMLYGDKGIGNSLANLAQHGLSGNVDTPGGGIGASIKVDADNIISNLAVDAETRKKIRNVNDLMRQLETNTLRQSTQAIGGGHQNQSEFQSSMLTLHGSADPIETLKRAVSVEALKTARAGSQYDDYHNYINDPANARSSHGAYLGSKRRKDTLSKYDTLLNNAYEGK